MRKDRRETRKTFDLSCFLINNKKNPSCNIKVKFLRSKSDLRPGGDLGPMRQQLDPRLRVNTQETGMSGHGAELGKGRGDERQQGFGIQEWDDGSRYEGEFVKGLKHGKGKYTWKNGEYYEGFFHKDSRHGEAQYCWPTGHKFIGKFYLNRKEGYGQQVFPDGTTFKGLYRLDQRFGPGVITYPHGSMDVGLWVGGRLVRLCDSVEDGFSLKNLPEYAAYMDPAAPLTQPPNTGQRTERSTTSVVKNCCDEQLHKFHGDHLPLPPSRRRELDRLFFDEGWEPDEYQGYERDPIASLPFPARMEAHIHRHRLEAERAGWDVGAVLASNRKAFGPKGPLEVVCEQLIQHASRGELEAVSQIIQTGLVHPDVADSRGHTALIAATVNRHHDVIHLLLNAAVDIDKLNCEGMSALAVCHVLCYPFQSLHAISADPKAKTQVLETPSTCTDDPHHHGRERGELERGDRGTESRENRESKVKGEERGCKEKTDVTEKMEVHLNTLKLLLERGADPNVSRIPLPVLFLAIMAADTEGVRRLLQAGAHTDIPLPPERKGLYPLHVAAALPGPAGPEITELLLHTITDPDARACDQNEIFEPDKVFMKVQEPVINSEGSQLREGGRTALHVACQRDSDFQNVRKVVALLLSHRASTDLLWSGHSPLSLAIATGNDLVVEELLKGGANPNIPLGCHVGSALCAFANIHYPLDDKKAKLLDMLVKAGADILMPVNVDGFVGTAMDYAYNSFNQDLRIASTPFHALNMQEREIFKARRRLLCMMRDLMRRTADRRERENLEREQYSTGSFVQEQQQPSPEVKPLLQLTQPMQQSSSYEAKPQPQQQQQSSHKAKLQQQQQPSARTRRRQQQQQEQQTKPQQLSYKAKPQEQQQPKLQQPSARTRQQQQQQEQQPKLQQQQHPKQQQQTKLQQQPSARTRQQQQQQEQQPSARTRQEQEQQQQEQQPSARTRQEQEQQPKLQQQPSARTRQQQEQQQQEQQPKQQPSSHARTGPPLQQHTNPSRFRKPALKFCYHCGRSVSVKLAPCTRCYKVFYCSRTCKLNAWDERHKDECTRVSVENRGFTGTSRASAARLSKSSEDQSQRVPESSTSLDEVLGGQGVVKENYSFN